MLDCGNSFQFAPDCIFITHQHIDHTGEIAKGLIETGAIHPKIFCPSVIKERIRNVIHTTFALTKGTEKPKVHNKYTLNGVDPGTRVPVSYDKREKKRATMFAEIIKCFHTVPCIGYGFIEVRRKLKPEYVGLPQDKLNAIKSGAPDGPEVDISHDVDVPLFAFMGDTDERALYTKVNNLVVDNQCLEKFKSIIIECTFLDDEHAEHAKKDRHMIWSKLEPYVIRHPETRFILIHFSTRYSDDYIEKFFEKLNMDNVVPFIPTKQARKIKPTIELKEVKAPTELKEVRGSIEPGELCDYSDQHCAELISDSPSKKSPIMPP
jgi:ribonuclease Z